MASMHNAAENFSDELPDTRDQAWFDSGLQKISPKLSSEVLDLLNQVFHKFTPPVSILEVHLLLQTTPQQFLIMIKSRLRNQRNPKL